MDNARLEGRTAAFEGVCVSPGEIASGRVVLVEVDTVLTIYRI